ncbi:MAG TPA: lamin tail domain-containing protein [Anaerolineaceae bacterium]|nr:lamin tail domain-containing protein [Anaerolineaceae bacterium]
MRTKQIAVAILLCLLAAWIPVRQARSGGLQNTTFLAVGQGDSIHLSDGQGFDVLIDGGKTSAGPTVLAYLRSKNITELDAVVVTHADADHVGGLIDVMLATDITVSQVFYNGYPGETATWDSFTAAVVGDGLSLTPLQYPHDLTWGAMSVHVLNPPAGLSSPETNAASVVLRVDYGEISYLLTGDIDAAVESSILSRATPVAAEILKVAHHGSSYGSSSNFLTAASPEEAVISVGENSYGHPAANTLDRLESAGAFTWRTDLSGNVWVENNGSCYSVYSAQASLSRSTCASTGLGGVVYLPLIVKSDPALPTQTPAPTLPPISSTGRIDIEHIFFDGVAGTAEPDEYVQIRNRDDHAVQMQGWKLSDAAGHVFTFPSHVMQPNQACRIYTNQVHSDWCGFSYGSGSAIWNNSGDTATLRNGQGTVVDSYSYPN